MKSEIEVDDEIQSIDQLTKHLVRSLSEDDQRSQEAAEMKVFQFMSEESIIERTKDCNIYFEKFVPPQPLNDNQVSLRLAIEAFVDTATR